MAAHVMDNGQNTFEPQENISMIVHQVTNEDISVDQRVTVKNCINENNDDLYTITSKEGLKVYDEPVTELNSSEENVLEIEKVCVSNHVIDKESILEIETTFI